jgi:transglutaminase/protease-like cytokinesis protein 3
MKGATLLCCVMLAFAVHLHAQTDFEHRDFAKADSIAALYPRHSLRDLKNLADKLTKSLPTEEEKFRAIYKWICNNIEYDYVLYIKNKQKREQLKDPEALKAWNKRFSVRVFSDLLHKQRTICSGYAYLVRELASHAGLPCVIVDGYGRTAQANIGGSGNANHSWNAVQLNKKWYLCDATWSSGAMDTRTLRYIKRFDDSYFLADPSLFVRNHYPLDTSWMLLKNKPTLKTFLNSPLIYSSIYQYKINRLSPETFDVNTAKGETVSFKFSKHNDKVIKNVELFIKGPYGVSAVSPELYQNSAGLYCIDHTFAAKGTYAIQILLNSSHAFAYAVEVK